MSEIKIIKQTVSPFPFNSDLALTEARNTELLFQLHLKRCDSAEAAEYLANIFTRLGQKFETKKLALTEKVR